LNTQRGFTGSETASQRAKNPEKAADFGVLFLTCKNISGEISLVFCKKYIKRRLRMLYPHEEMDRIDHMSEAESNLKETSKILVKSEEDKNALCKFAKALLNLLDSTNDKITGKHSLVDFVKKITEESLNEKVSAA
jgi:hypothetical protein